MAAYVSFPRLPFPGKLIIPFPVVAKVFAYGSPLKDHIGQFAVSRTRSLRIVEYDMDFRIDGTCKIARGRALVLWHIGGAILRATKPCAIYSKQGQKQYTPAAC